MKKLYFSTIVLSLCCLIQQAFAQSAPMVYSSPGAYVYTVPSGASVALGIDVRGAQGGNYTSPSQSGGKGGRVQGTISVAGGTLLYVYVGAQAASGSSCSGSTGGSSSGGSEDGGNGTSGGCGGAGGGAASDVRTTAGSLTSRILVGGGGGGSSYDCGSHDGGAAGYPSGTAGVDGCGYGGGGGGTQTAGGAAGPGSGSAGGFGPGGAAYAYYYGGGGGGGWYGGGGSYSGSGGGGSNYAASSVTSVTETSGYQSGNGYVSITVLCNASGTITGTPPVCIGSSATLANTTAGATGSWISSNPAVATVDPSSGLVTGVSAGTTTITYNVPSPCGALATMAVNINPSPAPLSGVGSGTLCTGLSETLTSSGTGTWVSTSPSFAVVSSSGVVTGISAGVTTISYTLLTGCSPATATITVNPNPSPIVGSAGLCQSSSATLSDPTPSGTWTTGTPSVATIGATSGTMTGVSTGNTNISYTLPTGCYVTLPVTVNPIPAPIFGGTTLCVGATSTLTDGTSGGSWFSSNPAQATINAGSGLLTGVYAGSPTIYYTLASTGCKVSTPVVINPLPAAISGASQACVGTTTTLTDAGGGTWFSSNLAVATVGVGSGIVTGISGGSATMTYTLPTGCSITTPFTVNTPPAAFPVTGGGNYCSSDLGVHVGLVFGSSGVSYQLYIGGTTPVGSAVAGSNSSLDFGVQSTVGTYTVVGSNGISGCSSNMTGSVHIGVNPSPILHNITGGGGYCPSTTGAPIATDLSDAGISYKLYNGTTLVSTLTGTGSGLSYGNFTTPGTYTVVATNISSGCNLLMGGTATVYEYPSLTNYAVSGGGGFCPSGTGTHVTLLPASDLAASYQLYYNGVATGLPVPGTGVALDFGSETATGTYTVIATDLTYGCNLNMTGGVTVFNFPVPTAYAVTGGGNYCSGGVGQHVGVAFGSTGISYTLLGPGGPSAPVLGSGSSVDFGLQTLAGTYSVLAVNPSTSCSNIMSGSATISESIAPGVYTVGGGGSYCAGGRGVVVNTSGSEIGVNYQLFKSGSPVGAAIAGTGSGINFDSATSAGTYTVIATNATAPCTSNMAGSANISISPLPSAYVVTGGGNYCVGGTGAHIILSGSQPGVSYQLLQGTTPEGILTEGTGSAIDFGLLTDAGAYTVVGVNDGNYCQNNMTGTTNININPLPNLFNVTGGGNYCAGGAGKHIGLDASNTGVSYQLYKDNILTGGTLVGSGAALDYGLKTAAGTYSIIGTNVLTGCKDHMNLTTDIVINPLPADNPLATGGNYCAGGLGIDINMPTTESGISYQLYLAGVAFGLPQTGTGAPLDFGTMMGAGAYTVVATNPLTSCSKNMSGSSMINVINPTVYTVTGGGNYCAGDTGVHVMLTGSSTSDNYQLFVTGSPDGVAITGTGSSLDFGLKTTSGTYTVVATDIALGCPNNMAGGPVVGINALPDMDSVTGSGAFCAGSAGVHVGLNGSSTGISYQLYSGTATVGSPVAGTGASLDFGLVTSTGSYTAVATDVSTHCKSNMLNPAVITAQPAPTAYRVSIENSGNYCAADSGLHIMLSNSDLGVNYQLFRNGITPVGTAVAGTGAGLNLGLENVAGTYTVVANNPTTTCGNNMLGSSPLYIIPLPTVYTVTGGGSFCPAADGVHVGLDGSTAGIYYQLYNGSTSMGTKFGTGASIDFGLQTDPGTYMVVANSAVTTCPNNMFGGASVVVEALATPDITLRAYPGTGVGVWKIDSMKVFISSGGGPNPTYQWLVNGHAITGATSQTFTRYELFNNDVVSCQVTGSGPCGGLATTQSLVISLENENVGVATVSGSSDIRLVPNPNKGAFTVKGTLTSTVDQEASIEITNMLGQNVYSGKVMTQGGNVDQHIQLGSNLPNGMYLLNLRAGTENIVFHFVIEQ